MQSRKRIISLLEKSYNARINNLELSIDLSNNALLLCTSPDLKDLKAKALSNLSLFQMILGENEKSTINAHEALKLYEEIQDEKGIADIKYSIAGVYYKTNNYHIGLVYLIDALNIYKKFNDYHNISRCEKSIGTIYEYFGDVEKAIDSYQNAINAGKQINDLNLISNAYNNLSSVYTKQGRLVEAIEIIEKSMNMKIETRDIRGLAFAIYGRGKVLLAKKQYEEAELNFIKSINIHIEMGEKLGLAMAYHKLAKLYIETNNLNNAKDTLSKAFVTINQYNIILIKFKCYHLLYNIYKLEKNQEQALEYLELYIKEKEAVLNTQTLKVIDNYDMLVQMKTMQKEAELQIEKAEMIEKNNRAEEAARVRQEFLSTMSHEIRTPLNAVTTIVTMLSNESGYTEEHLIEPLKFSTNHLMRIINDILDFTKLDLEKVSLNLQPTNLSELLNNFKKTYEIHAKEKGLKFILIKEDSFYENYNLDETKLTQILGNLISNAIKFTDVGKVILNTKIIIQDDFFDTIIFEISDTGEGIEEDKLELIFDSFSQIKNVTTRKEGGTGLGLAIVKKLIQLHKSDIKAKSTFGKGTLFSFELKLEKVASKIIKKTKNNTLDLKGKKLLLAEDNAINALIAKTLISKWGIHVDHVLNGVEATEKANSNHYDYILMDIHMPIMDGFEATKIIREKQTNKTTPIFGLTADISAKENLDYTNYFTDFLYKPLEIDKLQEALMSPNY